MKGKLIVVSGPSGAGKSTVTKIARDKLNIPLTISATTREPRPDEADGIDYYFLPKEKFMKKVENDEFFEWAEVHGNYYGTLKAEVEKKREEGNTVLLEIDVQGGLIVKEKDPSAVLVFFKAPNEKELEKRLRDRGSDSEDVIHRRLENALKEMEYEKKYDYSIINNSIDQSFQELMDIINQ
jgi:guanylate kinase